MLVHRDNDEKSGDDEPARVGRPQIVTENPVNDGAEDAPETPEDDGAHDGKTHLIGDALKSVYQRTLEEDIPDDFLDLLKQLK